MASDRPRRARNAAATREAILQSALTAFSRHGYDGIGVREIAQTAGVTAVLVNRYFGSKEALFAASVELAFADHSLYEGGRAMLAQRLVAKAMARAENEAEPADALHLLLRSAPNPRAAEILRESLTRHCERLESLLDGAGASVRAAMILAVITGLRLLRNIVGSKALAETNGASPSDHLTTLFQCLINGPGNGRPPAGRVKKINPASRDALRDSAASANARAIPKQHRGTPKE